MNISSRNRNVIVTLLLSSGAVAYVLLLFLPSQRETSRLYDELHQQQKYVTQSTQVDTSIAAIQTKLVTADDYSRRWQSAAPSPRNLASTLGQITDCATASSVEMLNFAPQSLMPMQAVSKVPVSLSCSGTYVQLIAFLRKLESLPQSIWIDDLLLTSDEETGEKVKCELTLVIFADNHKDSD